MLGHEPVIRLSGGVLGEGREWARVQAGLGARAVAVVARVRVRAGVRVLPGRERARGLDDDDGVMC
jgi:hypothetical protein